MLTERRTKDFKKRAKARFKKTNVATLAGSSVTDALLAQGEFKAWGKSTAVLLLVVGPANKCPRCAGLVDAAESLLAALGKSGRKGLKVLPYRPSVRADRCCFSLRFKLAQGQKPLQSNAIDGLTRLC